MRLTKEVDVLYNENYKTLLKETEHTNKWRAILCLISNYTTKLQ